MTQVQWQLLTAFFVPFVLQLMKRSQLGIISWLNQNTPKVNIAISAFAALFLATGIHLVHTPGSLVLTWPAIGVMATGFTTFLVQLGSQHVSYEAFWRHFFPASPIAKDALKTPIDVVTKTEAKEVQADAQVPSRLDSKSYNAVPSSKSLG